MIVVGGSDEPLEVNLTHLLIGYKTITGEIVGTAIDERTAPVFHDQIRRVELRPHETGVNGVDAVGYGHDVSR